MLGLCEQGHWWGLITYPIAFGAEAKPVTHWVPAWALVCRFSRDDLRPQSVYASFGNGLHVANAANQVTCYFRRAFQQRQLRQTPKSNRRIE